MSDENVMIGSSDQELFNDALVTTEPEKETPKENVDQPLLEQAATLRDEQGRFAPKQEAEPKAEEPEQPPQQTERKEPPEFRFREVSEAKRLAEEKAAALEAQNRQLVAMLQQNRGQPAAMPQQDEPDPIDALLTNPEAFLRQREEQSQMNIGVAMTDMQPNGRESRIAAHEALMSLQASNPAAYHTAALSIMNAPPLMRAQSLIEWHKSHQAQQRVGNDPDAFFSRTLEERLSDPAFAAQLVEKLTGQVRQQPQNGNGRPAIDIPPSLSRVTTAAPATGTLGDMTDQSIFENALR